MKKHRKTGSAPQSLERPRVALVEDDPDFRAIVRGWLRARYDTISFESAEEWLDGDEEALAPDLLITDVKMPGLNGFKLCETVRAHPAYADLPILFLTGVDSDEGFLLGQEAGASAYLTKPVERAVLLAKIEELLRVKGMFGGESRALRL
jgi:DNA-binding response OmpR family regulator